MRAIEFRAWDIINKKMLQYGEIMHLPMWEVLPGTPEQRAFNIMQYTGLKDEDGKEVYEGDVVKVNGKSGVVKFGTYSYSVCDDYECCRYGYYADITTSNYVSSTGVDIGCLDSKEIIIMGNIYENPKLLDNQN